VLLALGLMSLAPGATATPSRAVEAAATILTTPAPASITLHASATQIQGGKPVTLTGLITNQPGGDTVNLYGNPYPYHVAKLIASNAAAPNGTFSFVVRPDRNTQFRANLAGTSADATVTVGVLDLVKTRVKALPLGQARVTVLVYHPSDLRWNRAHVHWWFGSGRHGRFMREPSTRTKRLSRYVTKLTTTVTLPAGRFRWLACLRAPDDQALLDPGKPRRCHGRGYQGNGHLPFGFPSARAIASAAGYLGGRTGRTAFAVVDSEGRLSGVHEHWTFVSASVVKAMLLVAYLRQLHSRGQHYVDGFSNSFLYPMINVSDNNAAAQCWSYVGDGGLYELAHAAGMTDFSIVGIWANAQISAADQARYFFEMDSLIPGEFRGYARSLLSTIAGDESWGIPAVARGRGWTVFFKGGWRGTGLGQLVHQSARLERPRVTFGMAVLTDGDPSMGYGIDTIQGVTGALLS
jgi:hypothetical protein